MNKEQKKILINLLNEDIRNYRGVFNRTRNEGWKDKIDERLELIEIIKNMDEPKQVTLDY